MKRTAWLLCCIALTAQPSFGQRLPQDSVQLHPQQAKYGSATSSSTTTNSTASGSTNNSLLERGKFFSRHAEYKEALDFFNRAAVADPKNPEPYNRRARAEWQLEDVDHALEDARYAIKLNPDYAEAFCTRAAILNSMGHYNEAVADASLASELKPTLRDSYILEAAAYRNLRQYREADEALAKLNSIANSVSAFDEYAPNIDYNPYLGYLQNTIRKNWQPPAGDYGSIVVLYKVHRSGQITDVRVNNSGSASADSAAIAAAKNSAPFLQPPAGSPPDFDVFTVLDPPPRQMTSQNAPPPAAPNPVLPNFGGTLNQGLGLMQRFIPR